MTEMLGYMASIAVLATFLARTMISLRLIALSSNLLFLLYGYSKHLYPVFFLHVALLPINGLRLIELCAPSNCRAQIRFLAIARKIGSRRSLAYCRNTCRRFVYRRRRDSGRA
jgi:hypothetical protein